MKRRRLCDDEDDWEEDDGEFYDPDEEAVHGHGSSYEEMPTGPSHTPVWTGLLSASGAPILRHPVVIRIGFHPERNKYATPTLEDGEDPSSDAVVGWMYDA